jgi:hypothetical protein
MRIAVLIVPPSDGRIVPPSPARHRTKGVVGHARKKRRTVHFDRRDLVVGVCIGHRLPGGRHQCDQITVGVAV